MDVERETVQTGGGGREGGVRQSRGVLVGDEGKDDDEAKDDDGGEEEQKRRGEYPGMPSGIEGCVVAEGRRGSARG